jgi:hypothetical protein
VIWAEVGQPCDTESRGDDRKDDSRLSSWSLP